MCDIFRKKDFQINKKYFLIRKGQGKMETENSKYFRQLISKILEDNDNISYFNDLKKFLKDHRNKDDFDVNYTSRPEYLNGRLKNTALILLLLRMHVNQNIKEIILILLQIPGIDVNCVDYFGNSALSLALYHSNLEDVIEVLLSFPEIDLNIKNQEDESVLSKIISKDRFNKKMAEMIIFHPEIDVNMKILRNSTPIILACKKGKTEIVKLLVKNPKLEVNGKHGERTALIEAASLGHLEIVEILLGFIKINVKHVESYDGTALSAAEKKIRSFHVKYDNFKKNHRINEVVRKISKFSNGRFIFDIF